MIFKDTTILTENMDTRKHVDVKVSHEIIESITDYDSGKDYIGEEVIDGSKYLLMPGFYNAHAHSPMTLMRGYGENLPLDKWLFDKVFPFEDKLTNDAVYYGTLLAMAESLKHGIVSTSDMYYFIDDMVRAYDEAGTKGNISRAIANPTGEDFSKLKSVQEYVDAVKKYNGLNGGKIIMDGSLHAEYTSDEKTAKSLAELTNELGLIMHVHASESKKEYLDCKERHEGRTPIKYLYDCGMFDGKALAAHCVWLEDEDRDILTEKDVTVASNPVSNLKLANGICDVKKLMDKGIRVAIGTDSVTSNNSLSMFEETKLMSLLAKYLNDDPTVITPAEAITMATRNGALAMGRDDCGFIKEGFHADMIALRLDSPNMEPVYNMSTNIVLSTTDSDIALTMVDGRILYKDGEFLTIDLDKVIAGAKESIKDILSRL